MKLNKLFFLSSILALMILCPSDIAAKVKPATSPNKLIRLTVTNDVKGNNVFNIEYKKFKNYEEVMTLPVKLESKDIKISQKGTRKYIKDQYEMKAGKSRICSNEGYEYSYQLTSDIEIIFRLYNDGVTFRYASENGTLNEGKGKPNAEALAYRLKDGTKRWLQRFDMSYEGFFPMTTDGNSKEHHWGYPALMQTENDVWALISEGNIDYGHSASSLFKDNNNSVAGSTDYLICPEPRTAGYSTTNNPWRVVMIGKLSDIVESTLVTDVSAPCKLEDTDWIKPGVVSWVYWAYNRGSKDYQIVKQYIDMGEKLHLPYVLIDWEWDVMQNGGTIDDALALAAQKNVKTLLWYNSSTAWTTNGAGGPLFKLNKPEDREKEFAMLESRGVAGVKIDFFSGDTQETMDYCQGLLECAARHHLLVNFHGATIPRGWQRTYPNLMSTEAVYGAEWYNNAPVLTNRAASHNATLPFTRNVIGSMDYTPCTFSDSQHPHITSHAHELALTVVFESALQHLADKPESYLAQPKEVQDFFGELPTVWDETRLIGGYPGDYVVMARRQGNTWYIGALNGKDEERDLIVDWSFLKKGSYSEFIFADSGNTEKPWKFTKKDVNMTNTDEFIHCQPRGGFVIKVTENK